MRKFAIVLLFLCLQAKAAEILPTYAGQMHITAFNNLSYAVGLSGEAGGFLAHFTSRNEPTATDSVWLAFQLPSDMSQVSGVSINGNLSALFTGAMSASFWDIDPQNLPGAGVRWSAIDHPQIGQASLDAGSGISYGWFGRTSPAGGYLGDSFSVQGTNAMLADMIARQGGMFYLAIVGSANPEATISLSGISLDLQGVATVAHAPLPAAGWLFLSALGVIWPASRRQLGRRRSQGT